MKNYEYILLKLLNAQLTNNNKILAGDMFVKTVLQLSDSDWWNLIKLAQNHNVLSIIAENEVFIDNCNHAQKEYIFDEANKVVMRNYRLLWLASKYQKILNDAEIESVLIKGFATAIYYDVPEVRKSGDIDILIMDKNKIDKAIYVLLSKGLKYVDKQHSSHHIELVNDRGITVELHQTLAEHFDNKHMDNQLQNIVKSYKEHIERVSFLGNTLYIPSDGYNAFSLIVHMLQHYLRAGFGLKLLCDWVVFWNRAINDTEKEQFIYQVKQLHMETFVSAITSICVRYLGLSKEKVSFMMNEKQDKTLLYAIIMDIIEAEEFGYSDKNRMVVLRDSKINSLIREFHHQMIINYPKMSHYIVLWPVLWVCTLLVFLRNNKKVRHTSTFHILKNASKRSQIRKRMEV